jgi:hypothetical protein
MLGDNLADCHPVGHHGHDRRNRHPHAADGRLAVHHSWVSRNPAEAHDSTVLIQEYQYPVAMRTVSDLINRRLQQPLTVATTRPSISRRMKPSPILIGMRNLSRPGEPLGSYTGSHQQAGNPAKPASMTDRQGSRGANYGSQCPPTPGLGATPWGESAGGGSPHDSLRPAQTPDSCLGQGVAGHIWPSRPAGKVR